MSTAAKWLLIVLLALMIHALFMTSIAVGSGMGGETDIFPFHHVDAVDIGRIVAIEMLLAFILLIGLAVALLRHSTW